MSRIGYTSAAGERTFHLTDSFSVGRDPDNDLVLMNDAAVSRRHARLRRGESGYELADLGSQNGTFLARRGEETRVTGSLLLQHGDVIRVGQSRLIFQDDAPTDSTSKTVIADPHLTSVPGVTKVGRFLPTPPLDRSESPASRPAQRPTPWPSRWPRPRRRRS